MKKKSKPTEAFRVESVFECDLDDALNRIDKKRAELLRILDLPKADLSASDCAKCSKTLCNIHMFEVSRIQNMNPGRTDLTFPRKSLVVRLPRYALVYRMRLL